MVRDIIGIIGSHIAATGTTTGAVITDTIPIIGTIGIIAIIEPESAICRWCEPLVAGQPEGFTPIVGQFVAQI